MIVFIIDFSPSGTKIIRVTTQSFYVVPIDVNFHFFLVNFNQIYAGTGRKIFTTTATNQRLKKCFFPFLPPIFNCLRSSIKLFYLMTKPLSNLKKTILALAPMAGYTDSAFRVLCLKNGADIVYTEMISAEGLARQNNPLRPRPPRRAFGETGSEARKTLKMLEFLPGEKNVVVQLFGTSPEAFAKAARIINTLSISHGTPRLRQLADPRDDINPIKGIDVNFGCPAKKVFHTGAGAALMNNKKLAREIIEAVLKNTKLPVSIKIRAAVKSASAKATADKNTSAVEFIKYIKDLPIAVVMVHGRTLAQGFSGPVDYEIIRKVKKLLPKTVVLGNGGIFSPADAKIMLEKTGCDGVGIGRGALGNPWIFKEIKKYCRNTPRRVLNAPRCIPTWKKIKTQMLAHTKLFLKQNENLIPLRKHLVWYVKGLKNASRLRQKLIKIETLEGLKRL